MSPIASVAFTWSNSRERRDAMTTQITRREIGRIAAGAASALVAAPHVARAAFPDRTLHIMVGFAAGGTLGTISRILADAARPLLWESIVVGKRPGGGGRNPGESRR